MRTRLEPHASHGSSFRCAVGNATLIFGYRPDGTSSNPTYENIVVYFLPRNQPRRILRPHVIETDKLGQALANAMLSVELQRRVLENVNRVELASRTAQADAPALSLIVIDDETGQLAYLTRAAYLWVQACLMNDRFPMELMTGPELIALCTRLGAADDEDVPEERLGLG